MATRKLVKYANGEHRVIDPDSMTGSEFLHHSELDHELQDYDLSHEIIDEDIIGTLTIREEK